MCLNSFLFTVTLPGHWAGILSPLTDEQEQIGPRRKCRGLAKGTQPSTHHTTPIIMGLLFSASVLIDKKVLKSIPCHTPRHPGPEPELGRTVRGVPGAGLSQSGGVPGCRECSV